MKIIIAPDSFKESLRASQVCDAIESGMKNILTETKFKKIPLADGGEGTMETILASRQSKIIYENVCNPLGKRLLAPYAILKNDNIAVIEMAKASGLQLLQSSEQNPMFTATYGTGELIKYALDRGCRDFYIGVGGSATTELGFGALKALGIKFLDKNGESIFPIGSNLQKITDIDISQLDQKAKQSKFFIACDVKNKLLGKNGAAQVYSKQKGAIDAEVQILAKSLESIHNIILRKFNIDIDVKYGGAGGGFPAGFLAFLNAELKSGAEIVHELLDLPPKIAKCDLIITGEGQYDSQTKEGKTVAALQKLAQKYNKPVIILTGNILNYQDIKKEIILSITPGLIPKKESIEYSAQLLEQTGKQVAKIIKTTQQIIQNEE